MRIYGIGVDIVEIERISKILKNRLIVKRLFSENEISKCKKVKNNSACFAKKFAAKEAFSKALGTGLGKLIKFKEIIILNEKKGKPYIKLTNTTKKNVEKRLNKKSFKIFLSLSDESKYAIAFVTIVS